MKAIENNVYSLLLIILFVLFFGVVGHSQDNREFFQLLASEQKELLDRTGSIDRELTNNELPAWAGLYSTGNGFMGTTLRLSPISGFTFQPYTDYPNNIVMLFDFGTILEDNRGIFLHSSRKVISTPSMLSKNPYHLVKWGERRSIVPEEQIKMVINLYNAGCSKASDNLSVGQRSFLTRVSDKKKKIYGKPLVPKKFESLIIDKPINSKVLRTEQADLSLPPSFTQRDQLIEPNLLLHLDKGLNDSLWEGMTLYVTIPKTTRSYFKLEIIEVSENSSKGIVYRNYGAANEQIPMIGMEFSTRLSSTILDHKIVPSTCR